MKRIFSCLLLLLITTSFVVTAQSVFQNPSIVDDAGYLMQSELSSLSKELDEVREKYGFEVAIYTESDMGKVTFISEVKLSFLLSVGKDISLFRFWGI